MDTVSTGQKRSNDGQAETEAATDVMIATLRDMIAQLKQANASLEAKYATLEKDRDEWREHAKQLALPAPKPQETPATTPATVIVPAPDPVTESVGARLRDFLFESDPVWRWKWRRRSG
jgi:hypothetical protein